MNNLVPPEAGHGGALSTLNCRQFHSELLCYRPLLLESGHCRLGRSRSYVPKASQAIGLLVRVRAAAAFGVSQAVDLRTELMIPDKYGL
jgi:hypothetical protein